MSSNTSGSSISSRGQRVAGAQEHVESHRAHHRHHEGEDATVTHSRRRAWHGDWVWSAVSSGRRKSSNKV